MEIKDKVIVITGAARGLGKNFALDLATVSYTHLTLPTKRIV